MDTCHEMSMPEQYLCSGMIALSLLLLLWMTFMRTRQYYGDYRINKLTFNPLKSAAVGLVANTIYTIFYFVTKCHGLQDNVINAYILSFS